MRQFFTLRYWATLAALVGLAVGVMVFTGGDDSAEQVGDGIVAPAQLHVDLITPVFGVQAPQGIEFADGLLLTDIALLLDPTRTMVVKAGTPGDASCADLVTVGQCVVAADLLGDAVLHFSLVSATGSANIKLPAVVEMLDGQKVLLANGWVVPRAFRVERQCDEETTSLPQFIDTYGEAATATFDFEAQEMFRVTCPRVTATTTTLPATTVVDVTIVIGDDPTASTIEPG